MLSGIPAHRLSFHGLPEAIFDRIRKLLGLILHSSDMLLPAHYIWVRWISRCFHSIMYDFQQTKASRIGCNLQRLPYRFLALLSLPRYYVQAM